MLLPELPVAYWGLTSMLSCLGHPAYRNACLGLVPNLARAESEWAPCRKTTGTIHFIAPLSKWETEKPFNLSWPLPYNQPRTNSIYDRHKVQIADGRGREGDFSLDIHGFAFARMPTGNTLHSREAIETEYLAQVESWLKQFLGAEKVVAFDFAVCSTP